MMLIFRFLCFAFYFQPFPHVLAISRCAFIERATSVDTAAVAPTIGLYIIFADNPATVNEVKGRPGLNLELQ